MRKIETNIYEILNLKDLNCKYRKYSVRGLSRDSPEYHKNVQHIISKLSSRTQSPCQVITEGDSIYIAQPEGFKELPDNLELIGTSIKIEKEEELHELRFDNLSGRENDIQLAVRFLQFFVQQPLMRNNALWRQGGGTYYNKQPDRAFKKRSDRVDLYRGFKFRVVYLTDNRLGICVDVSSKYLGRDYLPTTITADEFKRYKGRNCIYQYGDNWYEIKLVGRSDLNLNEITIEGKTLFEVVHQQAGHRKSPALISLPENSTALFYVSPLNQVRNVPSGLCKLTYTTQHPAIKRFHRITIKKPFERLNEIQFVVDNNLRNLTFGKTDIQLGERPLSINEDRINIPDVEFGNGKILSVGTTPGATTVPLHEFGRSKRQMLYKHDAGPYIKKPLFPQYFILPNSISKSFGPNFIMDLQKEFNVMYPETEIEYKPIPVPYNDSVQKSPYELGNKIIESVDSSKLDSGYGIVMIPRLKTSHGKEDPLENLVMAKMRKRDIYVSVIHTDTIEESFIDIAPSGQKSSWTIIDDRRQQGKYKGYVKNVVLNKIMLLNHLWPFVLKTPLNADLTVGIDVKHNTAGFTLIYRNGADIVYKQMETDQKEKLSRLHVYKKFKAIIQKEQQTNKRHIKNIVIHRDGRSYHSEIEGINQAVNELADEGIIEKDANTTFIEIKKATRNPPLRIFRSETQVGTHDKRIFNPLVGTFMKLSEKEAFICNTGEPYRKQGTTNPLHILKCEGQMTLEDILHDVFLMANLTWTKIDDCLRDPMSIKMNDIRLRETAGDYDEDALTFGEEGEEDE